MTTSPIHSSHEEPQPRLSLVEPLSKKISTTPGANDIEHFDSTQFSESSIAIKIGELITIASSQYREGMSGKSGVDLEAQRVTKRRQFAYEAFKEFGMLSTMLDGAGEQAAETNFTTQLYNPTEKLLEQTNRPEIIKLIEGRINHPVIRAANRWALISGNSNENMRDDAIRVTRVAALILEAAGEAKYEAELEL